MASEEQPNTEKSNEGVTRKTNENDPLALPEARSGDQSLQELTSLVDFYFLSRDFTV